MSRLVDVKFRTLDGLTATVKMTEPLPRMFRRFCSMIKFQGDSGVRSYVLDEDGVYVETTRGRRVRP